MVAPPLLLDTPPAAPPRPGGLLAAATVLPLPARGEAGISYAPDTCAAAGIQMLPCIDGQPAGGVDYLAFDEDWKQPARTVALPFLAYSGADCTIVGTTLTELADRARRNLGQSESRAVESALWTGQLATTYPGGATDQPALATADTLTAAGSLVAAVSAIDAYIGGRYGFTGMVHAPLTVAAYAARDRLITADRGLLRTPGGNVWVFGGGYEPANQAPAGYAGAAAKAFLYATGWVTAYRSEVFLLPEEATTGFDRATNEALVFAARNYVLTWDCINAVVPVTAL